MATAILSRVPSVVGMVAPAISALLLITVTVSRAKSATSGPKTDLRLFSEDFSSTAFNQPTLSEKITAALSILIDCFYSLRL